MLSALTSDPASAIVITGPSGVGKSSLVLDALTHLAADPDDSQFVAMNLRHLPATSVELRAVLGSDLREVLWALSAPRRYLVVDAAEAALESNTEVLSYLVAAARDSMVRLIAVTSTEGTAVISSVMAEQGLHLEVHRVEPLADEELDEMVDRFPRLRPLIENTASRDLVRRPVVADLLVRAGAEGEILSEAAAMRAIWQGVIRNNGLQTRGLPAARDRVMRDLALDSLFASDMNESDLDAGAVAGLRADGVLQVAGSEPWVSRLEFAHDQLRTYAVAVVLDDSSDLVADLGRAGVPRWALAATRIAAQLRLESSSDPVGMFTELQAAFDEIADEHGGRWADVPSEALLASSRLGLALRDLWPELIAKEANGLARVLRLVDQRHRDRYALRADAFGSVLEVLLDQGVPKGFDERVTELIDDWLRTLLMRLTPIGHELRVRLRHEVLDKIEANRLRREQAELERQEQLSRRTPEEVETDRLRSEEIKHFATFGQRIRSSRPNRRELPHEITNEWTVRRLALLGPDAGSEGAELLRQVAQNDPYRIGPAVETLTAPFGIAQLDRNLLAMLVEAYYVEEEEDEWGFGGSFTDDGVRDHDPRTWGWASPLAAYYRGPFLILFRSDLVGGVRALNRILNHAARHRERTALSHGWATENEDRHIFQITGEPRTYVGDQHVWQWHAGTGVGPYPCMSALQALEFAAGEWLELGMPLERLVALLLDGCENVSMVALIVRLLAQRLDSVGTLMDPFLREPGIWRFEFGRATAENHGVRARAHDQEDDTRAWTFREVSIRLGLATGDNPARADALRAIGVDLVDGAERHYREAGLDKPAMADRLAAVRAWAACLDTNTYRWDRTSGGYSLSVIPPDDVIEVLSSGQEEISWNLRAMQLPFRYTKERNRTGRIDIDISIGELRDDVAFVRSFQRPPEAAIDDASAAVAATAIAVHANAPGKLADTDVAWAIETLLASASQASNDWQYFGQGADRSAALALPRLLTLKESPGTTSYDEIEAVLHHIAAEASVETRTYLAIGLSSVFGNPCTPGRCAHIRARDVLISASRRCALGNWNPENARREERKLADPIVESLASIRSQDLIPEYMAPPIRGLSEAAVGHSCVAEEARELTDALLFHQARAVTARKQSGLHSSSEALIAARAALTLVDHDSSFEPLAELIRTYASNDYALGEMLTALAAAAEERPALATTLKSSWPQVIELVVALIESGALHIGPGYLDARSLSDLVPYETAADWHYLRRELDGDPIPWTDLIGWRDAIDTWVAETEGRGECLDRLLWLAEATLDMKNQVEVVLPWVEQFVTTNPELAVTRSRSIARWLRSTRAHVASSPARVAWQRIADAVVLYGGASAVDLAD